MKNLKSLINYASPKPAVSVLIALTLVLQACGSSDSGDDTSIANVAPSAAASASSNAVSVGDSALVELFSTGSVDPDGDTLSFSWEQTAGAGVVLDNADTETASFEVPTINDAETLIFELTVSDPDGESDTAIVSVDVPAGSASFCPAAIGNLIPSSLVSSGASENFCEITGILIEDGTLENGFTWFLEGALQVGDSDIDATLNIEGGTFIYGDNVDEIDHLFVFAGSSIQATGTAATPIHFTSDDDDDNGSAEWGGLFIRGDGDRQGENLLDYVVVAEAGAPTQVAGTTYMDNIVINGADDGTRLTFVQSHDSNRDGIRLQNTSARLSWILVTGATRDGIWYSNFNGLVKDYMAIHRTESGRSGIYGAASSAEAGLSNPRFVNVTLVGRDDSSESAVGDDSAREFGILFADNLTQGRFGNILIANFRNGCYEVEPTADISNLVYFDGVHCANEEGGNGNFAVVRDGGVNTENVGIGNGDGMRYYNGVNNPITFTGETAVREFTAGWYLFSIGTISNGLAADANALNGFNDGDTNGDGVVDASDIGASPFLGAPGPALTNTFGDITNFNDDVAADTGGYDLTHVGAVRSGADASAAQFNNWTIETESGEGFAVPAP